MPKKQQSFQEWSPCTSQRSRPLNPLSLSRRRHVHHGLQRTRELVIPVIPKTPYIIPLPRAPIEDRDRPRLSQFPPLARPPLGHCFGSLRLRDAKFLGVAVKHKPLPRNKPYLQHGSCAFKFGLRNAINECVAFKHRVPHGRKIIPLLHQLCA